MVQHIFQKTHTKISEKILLRSNIMKQIQQRIMKQTEEKRNLDDAHIEQWSLSSCRQLGRSQNVNSAI